MKALSAKAELCREVCLARFQEDVFAQGDYTALAAAQQGLKDTRAENTKRAQVGLAVEEVLSNINGKKFYVLDVATRTKAKFVSQGTRLMRCSRSLKKSTSQPTS